MNNRLDKFALFQGDSATITADLTNDGTSGIQTITANYLPPSPTNLTATPIAGGSIRLDWPASSPETRVCQYNVYRASGGRHDHKINLLSVVR